MRKIKVVFAALCAFAATFALGACGGDDSAQKTAPVYLGMTVGSAASAERESVRAQDGVSGDIAGKDPQLNQDAPFADQNLPSIEEKVKQDFGVSGENSAVYYAETSSEVYITVKLKNPDMFEILSFTLNNIKYQSYQFQEGSDSENLIFKVKTSSTAGFFDYTIDAIKYVEGASIKDVLISGEKTVKVGLKGEAMTYSAVSDERCGLDFISFKTKVIDVYGLLQGEGCSVKAILYDGHETLKTAQLNVGENQVKFDGLKPNTLYQYAIVGIFDNMQGEGVAPNILYKKAVVSDYAVLFEDVEVGFDQATFTYLWNNDVEDKKIHSLTLTGGGKTINLDKNALSAIGLLSGCDYTVSAVYADNLNVNGTISFSFRTKTKAIPTVAIENVEPTKSSVSFGIAVVDNDKAGGIKSIELFKGAEKVAGGKDASLRTFDNLQSNNAYEIRVTYAYDLNEGSGVQEQIVKEVFYTAPIFSVEKVSCANTSAVSAGETIFLEVKVSNPDGAEITGAKVNGNMFSAAAGTTNNSLLLNLLVNHHFEGGLNTLFVEEVYFSLRDIVYAVSPVQNNSVEVEINSVFKVKDFHFVDMNGKELDFIVKGVPVYIELKLNNIAGYPVESVGISGYSSMYLYEKKDFIVPDKNTLRIPYVEESNGLYMSLRYVTYTITDSSGEPTEKSIAVEMTIMMSVFKSDYEVVEITEAAQLKNMSEKKYYKLKNDIVLTGEWKNPAPFDGIFDGNGFTIQNMTFVGKSDSGFVWGLFSKATGVIKNLNLQGQLTVEVNSGDVKIGSIAAEAEILNLVKITSDVDIVFSGNQINQYKIGGLVGWLAGRNMITDCLNRGNITVSGTLRDFSSGIGGIGGSANEVYVKNTVNSGFVKGSADVSNSLGGILGYSNGGFFRTIIQDCTNKGEVLGNAMVGGIAGQIDFANVFDCVNEGAVNGQSDIGGIVGIGSLTAISNCLNKGAIEGVTKVGGIAGTIDKDSSVTDCMNSGTVTEKTFE